MFEAITNLIGAIASAGVGTVVGNIVEMNTPDNLKRTSKILTKVGAIAITAVISDLASKKIEDSIREFGKEAGLMDDDDAEDTEEEEKEDE